MIRASLVAALLAGSSVLVGAQPVTPTPTSTATGTPSSTATRSATGTRTVSRTASRTASETASETRTPSQTPTQTPSATPLVCSNPRNLVSVELFSNFNHGCIGCFNDEHFGDDLDGTLTVPCRDVPNPILDSSSVVTRRRLGSEDAVANPALAELEAEALKEQEASRGLHYFVPTPSATPGRPQGWDFGQHYSGSTYGGVVLTDQQPVALTFTSPCTGWPCTFGLKRLDVVLHNLPPYNVRWDAPAAVFFKIELGRYYTNLPPPVVPTPWRRALKEEAAASRMLTSSPSFYEPYLDIQTTVWSESFFVGANQTLFHLDLSGLFYTTWRESPFVEAGDFKIIITPYIHYECDTIQPDQILWLLTQPTWNSLPVSDFRFSHPESFSMRPGCPAHHGIMSSSGRQLLSAEEVSNSVGGRELNNNNNAWNWWPETCILRESWACLPFYPSIRLEALLPCETVFEAVRDEVYQQREGEELIEIVPFGGVSGRRLHNSNSWNHQNVYYSIDCPPDYDGSPVDAPFVGADTTAFGRYISPNEHALRTVDLAGTVEHTDLLFVFQAPCTRCNIYLREIWLPLARDPLCAAEIHFHTDLGFWTGGGISGDVYERQAFSPSTWANGVHTVMTLGTHLSQSGIFMGSFDHKARIDIPYYGNGSVTWIGIHVTLSSCVRLGTGLDGSSRSLCPESPITPAALFTGAETPSNGTALHPVREVWLNSGAVPGIFAPVIKVEPWLPICIPLLPTPSPSSTPGGVLPPGASASPTAPGGSPSRTPSRHASGSTGNNNGGASPNPGHGASGTLILVGGLSTDNSASSGLMASIGAGGIAGIVIAAVAGAILVAAAVVVVVSKRSARASAASAAPATAAPAEAAAPAAQTTSGEAPARSPAGQSRPNATSP